MPLMHPVSDKTKTSRSGHISRRNKDGMTYSLLPRFRGTMSVTFIHETAICAQSYEEIEMMAGCASLCFRT